MTRPDGAQTNPNAAIAEEARQAWERGLEMFVVTIAGIGGGGTELLSRRNQGRATADLDASGILHQICRTGWTVISATAVGGSLIVVFRRFG